MYARVSDYAVPPEGQNEALRAVEEHMGRGSGGRAVTLATGCLATGRTAGCSR